MANRTLVWFLFAVAIAIGLIVAFGQAPTPPPSGGVFPITNGKLMTPLDANQFKIVNAPAPTGGDDYATKDYVDNHAGTGPGGSGLSSITGDNGTATGLTLSITGNTNVLTDPVFTLGATLNVTHGGTGATSAGTARSNLGLGNVDNTSDALKPISTATQNALDLKASITYVDAGLSGKATASDISTALGAFAGTSNITTVGTIATGTWQGTAIGSSYLPNLSGISAPSGDVSLQSHKITSLADPSANTDATNKQYVDAVANAGPPHQAVRVATTANGALATAYENGDTIDGIALATGNRILLKDQTTRTENGIYTVNASGAPTRAADANTGPTVSGTVFVSAGTANAGTTWGVTTAQPITLGVTNIDYTQTGANTVYTAGSGLTLTGSQFSITNLTSNGKILGRYSTTPAPAGPVQEITIRNGLTLDSSGNLDASGGGVVLDIAAGNLGFADTGSAVTTLFTGSVSTTGLESAAHPKINFSLTNAPAISAPNTGWFLGSSGTGLGYQPAATARTMIGATTVGASFLTLANPSSIRFPKILANNTVQAEDAPTYLGSLGAEPALTFSAPLARGAAPNQQTISMPAAGGAPLPNGTNGYLTGTDWNTFNSKVSTSRTLTALAPLTIAVGTPITGPPPGTFADLSANRTLSMPAATNNVDGYLTAVDHTAFAAKTGPDSEVILTNSGGLSASPATWTSGATAARETQPLNADRYVTLPPASAYNPGKRIVYTDNVTTGNFGRWFRPNGTDKLNGGTVDVRAFIAGTQGAYGNKAVDLECVGGASPGWQMVSSSTVFHVEDPADATKQFNFNASQQAGAVPGPQVIGVVTAAPGNSVTVTPTDTSAAGFVKDINASGATTKVPPRPSDILPVVVDVGQLGSNYTGTPAGSNSVTITTLNVSTIRIAGTLQGPLTIKIPDAGNYQLGQNLEVIDISGSVSSTRVVTITSTSGTDTFSGGGSNYLFDEAYGRRVFTADPGGFWSQPTAKTSIQGFTLINPVGIDYTISGTTTSVSHNVQLNLKNGANNLLVASPYDGMDIYATLVQPADAVANGAGTLTLPAGSRVGGSGLGVVTLSTSNGAVDVLHGRYNATLQSYLWEKPILDYSNANPPAAPSVLAISTPITSSNIPLTWTDNANNETGFEVQRCTGASCTTGFTTLPLAPANSVAAPSTVNYNDNSVLGGTTYGYKVRAYNSAPTKSAFNGNNVQYATALPATTAQKFEIHFNEGSLQPTSQSAAATVGPSATLTYADWTTVTENSPTNPAAFNPSAGMPAMGAVTLTPTPATCSGTCTQTYTYRVLAWKGTFHNSMVTAVSLTLQPPTLDGTHFNTLQWADIPGASYYEVYRTFGGTGQGGLQGTGTSFTPAVACTAGTCTFVDNNVPTNGDTQPSNFATNTDAHTASTGASQISYSTPSNINVVSVSFWVKSTFPGTNTNIVNGGDFQVQCTQSGGAKLRVTLNGLSGTQFIGTISTTGITSGWHLVVVQFDASTATATGGTAGNVKVYYDPTGATPTVQNTVAGTNTFQGPITAFTPSAVTIGHNLFAGGIDDVRIFDHALTATEMNSLTTGHAQ